MKRHQRLDQVVALLAPHLPSLPLSELREVVDRIAPEKALYWLQEHIEKHSDALTSGSVRLPMAMFRLLTELESVGCTEVVVPLCAGCGKRRMLRLTNSEGARICQMCKARATALPCNRCGKTAPVNYRDAEGVICRNCYSNDPARHEACTVCGHARRVAVRGPDGEPFCANCYSRPTRQCVRCGDTRPVKANTTAGPVCTTCYVHPQRPCGSCGRIRRIKTRARDGQPDLCGNCDPGPVMACSSCRRERPCLRVTSDYPVCRSCRDRPQRTCARCGRQRSATARWPMGPVCGSCYRYICVNPAECATCGERRPLIGVDEHQRQVCGPCVGVDLTYPCSACGNAGDIYRDGECARCVLRDQLHEQFGSTEGTSLEPLISALAAAETPRSVLLWMRRENSGATMLRNLLISGYPITHELLDTFPGRQAAVHLRQLLVHVAVLPERDEHVAGMERWLQNYLAAAAALHRGILQPYAQWVVLRRVRHQAHAKGNTASSIKYARTQVSVAHAFLEWVEGCQLSLADVRQPHVDQWLAAGASTRCNLRDFLRWARRCRLIADLRVPWRPDGEPSNFLDEDEHLALLHRCVHDSGLPLDVRAAGALTLLYGMSVTRIAQLTHQDIQVREGGQYIQMGKHPIVLPPALARLLNEQMEKSTSRSLVGRVTPGAASWIFPGALAGRPVTGPKLSGRLLRHGIDVRASRNTALMALASDLPAPILSEMLGIHINTAVEWVGHVKRDWAVYLAARSEDDDLRRPRAGE